MSAETPEVQRPRGTYPKGVARRQEILDAAIVVFANRGGGRTSLRAIAQEVGVSHAALIHHFGSLERLLVEVYEAGARGLSHAEPDLQGASPVEIMRLSAEHNHSVPGMVELYSTLVASALEDGHPEATAYISVRFARIRAELVEQIHARQAAGLIRADVDATQVAALIIAASDGLQTQWLLDGDVDQVGALALLDRLLAG